MEFLFSSEKIKEDVSARKKEKLVTESAAQIKMNIFLKMVSENIDI